MTVAVLDRVTKRFGPSVALDGVSLAIEARSAIALLGPNGAGKSTLVACLLGLRRPDHGSVRIFSRDPRDHRARVLVGAARQELAFPQTLRVDEVVGLVARHFPKAGAPAELLESFGLEDALRRQIGALSVGQRRRLGVALAFLGRPALIVLDEPTAGLDGDGSRAVLEAVAAALARGAAVLLTTHRLDEAEAVATRVVAIDRGRVVADGPVAEVKARAGATRVRFRAERPPRGYPAARVEDGLVAIDAADGGAVVEALVRARVPLRELEVRPLTLAETLARAGARR